MRLWNRNSGGSANATPPSSSEPSTVCKKRLLKESNSNEINVDNFNNAKEIKSPRPSAKSKKLGDQRNLVQSANESTSNRGHQDTKKGGKLTLIENDSFLKIIKS